MTWSHPWVGVGTRFYTMEAVLKDALKTITLKPTGKGGGGCINEGEAYFTDTGTIFVKRNNKHEARKMFDGEFASLTAIAATNIVNVPKPIVVLDNPKGGAVLVLEYLDMKGLNKYSKTLGEQLGRMHLHNIELCNISENTVGSKHMQRVTKFGFHVTTCCGYLPMDNTWQDDWPTFFIRQRINHQMQLLEKNYGDREARELWSQLQLIAPSFFSNIEIKPSLMHGDLWGGNVAENDNGPVIFDPASFYGHHEYELSISDMFGGFNRSFYEGYHSVIPKAPGFDSRMKFYKLFHNLNHWNHFGSGYRSSSLSLMRSLLK